MKKRLIILVAVLAVGGGVAGYFAIRDRLREDSDVLEVSGNLEVTDVELSFRLPGWVKERPVDEGDSVKKDQLVASLDDTELVQEVALRTAELANAKAALAELDAGSRPEEIAAAQATEDAAKVEVDRTQLDFDRLKTLLAKGVAAQNEFDTARSALDSAKARLNEAQAKLRLVKAGPREETKQAARARVEQISQGLEEVKTRLTYARLTSPVDGIVLSKNTEAGEFVAAGTPIVTVANLRDIWLRAYVDEPDLPKIKLGQSARIQVDGGPTDRYGKIIFISDRAEFTPKNVQTPKERVKQVFRIKISVPNDDLVFKPGMPADAYVKTK